MLDRFFGLGKPGAIALALLCLSYYVFGLPH